jgi:hypothetical protein
VTVPYKSDAQRRYFNANRAKLEAEGVDVDEYNQSSKGKKLPERVEKQAMKNPPDPSYDPDHAEECCDSCGARLECGDKNTCNRCGGTFKKNAGIQALAKAAAFRLPVLKPHHTMLGGALLGGLTGGALDYMSREEDDEGSVLDGILSGGLLGAVGGGIAHPFLRQPFENLRRQFNSRLDALQPSPNQSKSPAQLGRNAVSGNLKSVSMEDMLGDEYIDKAIPAAKDYRKSVSRDYKQQIDRDQFKRQVPVTNRPSNASGGNVGASYDPNTDTIHTDRNFDDRLNRDFLEHELTHSMQKVVDRKDSVTGFQNGRRVIKPRVDPAEQYAAERFRPGMGEYLSNPHEMEAYAAQIKRNYYRSTGKIVDSPEEARKAMDWAVRQAKGRGKTTKGLFSSSFQGDTEDAVTGQMLHNMLNGEEDKNTDYRSILEHLMPGLVKSESNNRNTENQTKFATATSLCSLIDGKYNLLDPNNWQAEVASLQGSEMPIKDLAKTAALSAKSGFEPPAQLDEEDEKKPKSNTMAHLLGAGAIGYGATKAPNIFGGSDQSKVDTFKRMVEGYDPAAFSPSGNSPKLPPNTTELGYYESLLSPAAQLNIAGKSVGDAMVGVRSSKPLMDKLEQLGVINNANDYYLSPDAAKGNNGMMHYRQFAAGPIPAYMHQISAQHPGKIVPPEFTGGREGVPYPDWVEEHLGKALKAKQPTAGTPWEMDTDFIPNAGQQEIMEQFHASLSPEAQKYRMEMENLNDDKYRAQVNNYLPQAKKLIDVREKLQAASPYLAGGAGGHALYKLLRDDKKQNWFENLAAVGAGAGAGKGIELLSKNPTVRDAVSKLIGKVKGVLPGNKEATDMATNIEKLARASAQAEKLAFLSWGGGEVGLHPKGRGIGGSVGYTNLLGTLPIPTAGIDIGGPNYGFMAGVTPDPGSDLGISPYIGGRFNHPRKSGVTRQFPRGLPDILYDKLRGRTRDDAFKLSYPDQAEGKKDSKPKAEKKKKKDSEKSEKQAALEKQAFANALIKLLQQAGRKVIGPSPMQAMLKGRHAIKSLPKNNVPNPRFNNAVGTQTKAIRKDGQNALAEGRRAYEMGGRQKFLNDDALAMGNRLISDAPALARKHVLNQGMNPSTTRSNHLRQLGQAAGQSQLRRGAAGLAGGSYLLGRGFRGFGDNE